MHDEHDLFDDYLARLARTLREGEHMLACLLLAEFALELDRRIRYEERALAFTYGNVEPRNPLATVRREHTSMRLLVSSIACALDRADDRRALDVVGTLRSVLLLHAVKEEPLLAPMDIH